MGKAHQAPRNDYSFTRFVASHATLRLRQRMKRAGIGYLDDPTLRRMLDHAVVQAIETDNVQRIREHGRESVDYERCKLADITGLVERLNDEPLYALIKTNDKPDPAECIVTIMDERIIREKIDNNKWTLEGDVVLAFLQEAPESEKGAPFNPALSALANVEPAPSRQITIRPGPPPKAPNDVTGELMIPNEAEPLPRREFVVRLGTHYQQFTSRQTATAFIVAELQNDEEADLDLYQRVPFEVKVKRVVSLEFSAD